MSFEDFVTFEDHYQRSHRHQCAICGRQFPNVHCLEIHSDENHCSIFKARRERDPSAALFRCYETTCSKSFTDLEERNSHSEKEHDIRDPALFLERRKLPRKEASLEARIRNINISTKTSSRTPRAVVFGDEQKEPTFVSTRGRVLARRRNLGKEDLN